MIDLTRLMFDDGASRPAAEEHEEYPNVLFECGGHMWEGSHWLPGDPWLGRGWTFSKIYPIEPFLNNPTTYAEHWWGTSPGWVHDGDPPMEPLDDRVIYTFREV